MLQDYLRIILEFIECYLGETYSTDTSRVPFHATM